MAAAQAEAPVASGGLRQGKSPGSGCLVLSWGSHTLNRPAVPLDFLVLYLQSFKRGLLLPGIAGGRGEAKGEPAGALAGMPEAVEPAQEAQRQHRLWAASQGTAAPPPPPPPPTIYTRHKPPCSQKSSAEKMLKPVDHPLHATSAHRGSSEAQVKQHLLAHSLSQPESCLQQSFVGTHKTVLQSLTGVHRGNADRKSCCRCGSSCWRMDARLWPPSRARTASTTSGPSPY